MKRLSPTPTVCRRGFSLIEMLVVVSIVVMLLALATPALTRTLQASRLAAAGEAMLGSIAEAQQTAFATNTPVDMRFFSFMEDVDQAPMYHSYQLFKITQSTQGSGGSATVKEAVVPVGNLIRLPEGVIIPTDNQLTGIFSTSGGSGGGSTGLPDTKENSQVGYAGVTGATYNAIRFLPDGTCRTVGATVNGLATVSFQPSLQQNFFTMTFGSGPAVTLATLPKNFFTIQIDPYTGKARSYKPGF
ncbi:Verru_Chthon cassette protein D [Prosthecobacter sp.]|uniref:Verru_Chthon cassette protein D n=1 Tax=Prosthecobacter sp. TaxID=1965333 RepID=UPI0037846E82